MNEVHEGLDGWLFLTGGSNQVIRLFTDPAFLSDAHVREWAKLLQGRATRLSTAGIKYLHLLVPDKISVLASLFGLELEHFAIHPLCRLNDLSETYGLAGHLLDPTTALATQPGRFPTFYKTDSHWTVWGAYLAYSQVCRALGLSPTGFDDRSFARVCTTFDLGGKLTPPRTEQLIFTPMPNTVRRIQANAIVAMRDAAEHSGKPAPMHHGAHAVFTNSKPVTLDRLVIFGDSFADYRPSTLTALFAETFAETHFVWSTSLDYDYIDQVKPDVVLTEIAERFMTEIPADDYDVQIAVNVRLDAFNASQESY